MDAFSPLLQLYAPFVGLAALCFWMGVLSQRVRQLEKDSDRGSLIELKVKMAAVEKTVGNIDSALQGINRQLANIAMNRVGQAFELPPTTGDRP